MLRLLHPFSAVALIVGIVIGAGIFKTPSLVASLAEMQVGRWFCG